jgi:hypothetical protein
MMTNTSEVLVFENVPAWSLQMDGLLLQVDVVRVDRDELYQC